MLFARKAREQASSVIYAWLYERNSGEFLMLTE